MKFSWVTVINKLFFPNIVSPETDKSWCILYFLWLLTFTFVNLKLVRDSILVYLPYILRGQRKQLIYKFIQPLVLAKYQLLKTILILFERRRGLPSCVVTFCSHLYLQRFQNSRKWAKFLLLFCKKGGYCTEMGEGPSALVNADSEYIKYIRRIQVAISYRICFEGVDTRHTGLYCQPVTNMAVNYNIYWLLLYKNKIYVKNGNMYRISVFFSQVPNFCFIRDSQRKKEST